MTRSEALEAVAEAARAHCRADAWSTQMALCRAVAALDAIPIATEPPPATVTLAVWENEDGYVRLCHPEWHMGREMGLNWRRLGTVTLEVKP